MLTKDSNLRIRAREIDEVLNNSFNLENMFEEMKVKKNKKTNLNPIRHFNTKKRL